MGREVRCHCELDGTPGEGRALLETDEVVFRGGALRFRAPFSSLTEVAADGDVLHLVGPHGDARLELGECEAARWAERIRNPPSLLDKLGLVAGGVVALVGPVGADVRAVVAERAAVADGLEAVDGADDV